MAFYMKYHLKKSLFLLVSLLVITTGKADEGKELFTKLCAACHTIGGGRLVGPDLKNIADKRTPEWLGAFIQSSQTIINSGDEDAQSIYDEYNKLLMPDQPLDDGQVTTVLNYIAASSSSTGENNTAPATVDLLEGATSEHVSDGLLLFSGKKRLANGGASCISCHSVKDDRIFSSGTLAKDLTDTYELMGSAGVSAIIKSPPFPAMAVTYSKNPLTEDEVHNLTAYLRSVSQEKYYQHPADFSISFAIFGIFMFLSIFTSIIVLYFKRKRKSVNHEIHQRQTPVTN